MPVTHYRDLIVWRRAMELAEEVYGLSRLFPVTEKYGITSQILRSAVSVPANIAEGHARSGAREFLHFLSIASGSLAETETLLLLASRTGMVPELRVAHAMALADEVGRMVAALKKRLADRPAPRPPRATRP
jgi:four helix bundle protein